MTLRTDILFAIETFLAETGMEPSTFGRAVLGDPSFVFELREGRNPNTRTIDKVRRFIEDTLEQNKNIDKAGEGNRK